jgi:hypothetical protein
VPDVLAPLLVPLALLVAVAASAPAATTALLLAVLLWLLSTESTTSSLFAVGDCEAIAIEVLKQNAINVKAFAYDMS